MTRRAPRIEPFWAEIAADWPEGATVDWECCKEHLAYSALYDEPRTRTERERVRKALQTCRQMDPNRIGYNGAKPETKEQNA